MKMLKLLKEVKNRLKSRHVVFMASGGQETYCCTELSQCRQQDNVSG